MMSRPILAGSLLLALLAPAVADAPLGVSMQVAGGVPAEASAHGKYRGLQKVLHVPADKASYGTFTDFGFWNGNAYAGYNDLPAGHWVYAYPKWYIWKEAK